MTCAPPPNSTPFGLRMKTVPLALRLPKMLVASWPVTRFSAIAPAPGWMKLTVSPAWMPKADQSMASREDVWVMVVVVPFCPMLPEPEVTVPPAGAANAGMAAAKVPSRTVPPNALRTGARGCLACPVTAARVMAAPLGMRATLWSVGKCLMCPTKHHAEWEARISQLSSATRKRALAHRERGSANRGAGAICEWTLRAGLPDRPGMRNRGLFRHGVAGWPGLACHA